MDVRTGYPIHTFWQDRSKAVRDKSLPPHSAVPGREAYVPTKSNAGILSFCPSNRLNERARGVYASKLIR